MEVVAGGFVGRCSCSECCGLSTKADVDGKRGNAPGPCSSGMTAAEILTLLLARLWFFDTLKDFVTARAPAPPAAFGRPTPSLSCVSFAFRVRVTGGGGWFTRGWTIG